MHTIVLTRKDGFSCIVDDFVALELVAGQGGSEESQRWPLGELTITVNYRETRHILINTNHTMQRYCDTCIGTCTCTRLMYMSHTCTKTIKKINFI